MMQQRVALHAAHNHEEPAVTERQHTGMGRSKKFCHHL
jgi:hypothetical protein